MTLTSPMKPSDATELAQIDACMELAAVGYSYRGIAKELATRGISISHETVRIRLRDGRKLVALPNIEEAMKATHDRLLGAVEALAPKIESGDPEAIRAYARLESLIMDLFGTKKLVVQQENTHRVVYELDVKERPGFDARRLYMTPAAIEEADQAAT